jgi:hypothetical protein
MFDKISAGLDVFRKGSIVANPTAWKKGQITASMIGAALVAVVVLAKAFGYDIPLSNDDMQQIGSVVLIVFGLFNTAATVVSTDKVGLPAKPEALPDVSKSTDTQSGVQPVSEAAYATDATKPSKPGDTYFG